MWAEGQIVFTTTLKACEKFELQRQTKLHFHLQCSSYLSWHSKECKQAPRSTNTPQESSNCEKAINAARAFQIDTRCAFI